MSDGLGPHELGPWTRILRDVALVIVGAFMLIHETLAPGSPDPLIVGGGLSLLGAPQVLRLAQRMGGKE